MAIGNIGVESGIVGNAYGAWHYQTLVSTSLASFNNVASEDQEHRTPDQHWTTSQPPKSIIAPSRGSPGLPLTSKLYLEARKLPHLPLMEQLPRIPCDLLSLTSIHPYHGSPPQNSLQTTSLHHYYLLPSLIIQIMLRNRTPYSFGHQAHWPLTNFSTSGHPQWRLRCFLHYNPQLIHTFDQLLRTPSLCRTIRSLITSFYEPFPIT